MDVDIGDGLESHRLFEQRVMVVLAELYFRER